MPGMHSDLLGTADRSLAWIQAQVESGASVDTAGREFWEVKVEVKMHRLGGRKGGEVGIRRPLGLLAPSSAWGWSMWRNLRFWQQDSEDVSF